MNGLLKRDWLKSFFLYCTLEEGEFDDVRPRIWARNLSSLKITSLLAASMGGLFFLLNVTARAGARFPYLFLLCVSLAVYLLSMLLSRKGSRELFDLLLCYGEMLMVCLYAGFLSTKESNYAIPATSFVVFIAVLPLAIDDRPLRMYLVMLAEALAYLVASHALKSHEAFVLDIQNVGTFCVIGMVLYAVVCTRNVREIYQGLRVERIQQSVITSLATVVEERDENTGDHIIRTEQYVHDLIECMRRQERYAGIEDEYYRNVVLAAPMHDVGKIKIPDAILNKPGRLTDEEFEIMKQHAAYGGDIIRKTMHDVQDEAYYTVAYNIARHHHERYDGTGYPDGLSGEEIPLEARIMALADVYDALISERVYKKAFSRDRAKQIIREGSGTQFDPVLAELFLQCIE